MKKPIIQHLIGIGIFIVIAFLYTLPAFQGNEFAAGDTQHWWGMSQEARSWHEKTKETTLWSNSMFGGMPTATYAVYGISNAVLSVQTFFTDLLPTPFFMFLMAMISFYILAMAFKWNHWVGIIGGIAYAFASYTIQVMVAGHATKVFSIAYLPMVIAGVHWLYQGKYGWGISAALFALSLTISNGMYQIIYYLMIIIGGMGIGYLSESIKQGKLKTFIVSSIILVLIILLSIAPAASSFFFTKEYTDATMRGGRSELTIGKTEKKTSGGLDKDYAFAWSQSIGETFTLLIPNLYGGGNRVDVGTNSNTYEVMSELAGEANAENFAKNAPTYWGPQPFLAGPNYIGIIVILLFVMGMFLIRSRMKWFLLGLGVLGIMMSWGKHFSALNYLLFDYLPMYNKFRTPSMIMVIPAFTFTVVAIWALYEYFFGVFDPEKLLDSLKKSVIITGGLCLLLTLGGSFILSFKGDNDDKQKAQLIQAFGGNEQAGSRVFSAIVEDRSSIAMKDGFRSLAFILFAAALLWAFAKRKTSLTVSLAGVGLLMAVDILSIGTRYIGEENYMPKEDYEAQFNPRPIDLQIKTDPDPYYRVFDLSTDPFNDAMGAIHHKLVGGYSPAKMEVYQDLIDNYLAGGKMNAEVLNMLNTKYIIFNGQDNKPAVQGNPSACGNGWFVKEVKLVNSADEEMLAMKAESLGDTTKVENAFRPKEMAIVQTKHWKGQSKSFVVDSSSMVKLEKYGLNSLSFKSSNNQEGFAVFSDIYYEKGWKAFIDGKETPIVKTNYLLRGLMIPAGNHNIEFKFNPDSFSKWEGVSKIGAYLILMLVLGGIGMGIWQKEKTSV